MITWKDKKKQLNSINPQEMAAIDKLAYLDSLKIKLGYNMNKNISLDDYIAKQMADPEFKKAFEEESARLEKELISNKNTKNQSN